ncbi:tyrosine-type recombinase/integrase [Peribacillus butanolivorans]|uniref:Site-specific integrase n=1 Tax=Peribacillus butanolivorans TaxID=421767 RepID=A0AAX0S110_9BACI|nr:MULTISPECIES: tyrosine-type recombinase/integrase [Peribacillus]KQU23217.1 integrase [Bacillus sp. Leaf13]KRF61978.1 integrase [Bacillus sp. Soil768D1]AXN39477.1 site-specific integrase [Peribacillus butanolivorans]KON67541.1 integrase [Peribacillus butanolivorans]MBK5444769.1 tyrosine-type recombinase/integrase [Peribacillus sp. TH24]
MEYVEAFKDINQISKIKTYLRAHSSRDYLLFVLGINTGMKINEMLEITVSNVLDETGKIKEFYEQRMENEEVTQIYLNLKVRTALQEYLKGSKVIEGQFLFLSPKTKKPITRQQAHRIIHDAVEGAGLTGKFGASSMRKTFGYHAYKQGVSLSLIQKHYHHSSPSETLKYIGISKEKKFKTIIDVNL